ncbi:aromatic acid exporter family protein [Streptomyces sp. NPDC048438]|uniref:FUSC family protein n=1 Tax=Streptomyces sp. NPDC048438 TaxID=3365551 RepID=UPI003712A575
MADSSATGRTGTGRLTAAARWWQRAFSYAGDERATLLVVGKSTLAATLAWVIAYDVLDAASPAFAPFSAVLIMQVTVYRSVVQSLRYVGAVVAGVLVQAALGYLADPDLVTFVLMALIALAIGRWTVLGVQGPQVATAAFFAFSTYTSSSGDAQRFFRLGEIVVLVLIGCAIGTAVNILVAPPLRYRSAEYSIRNLARTLHDLLTDICPVLADQQAKRLGRLADKAEARRDEVIEVTDRLSLSLSDPDVPYGVLVTEASRLTEEFRYTCQVLLDAAKEGSWTTRGA